MVDENVCSAFDQISVIFMNSIFSYQLSRGSLSVVGSLSVYDPQHNSSIFCHDNDSIHHQPQFETLNFYTQIAINNLFC